MIDPPSGLTVDPMPSGSTTTLPVALVRRWWGLVACFGLTALAGYVVFYLTWHPARAMHWGFGATGALAYLLGYTRVHLPLNRRHAEASILPDLGLSNGLTLARGLLYGLLAGFLVVPAPRGAWAFAPGVLYTVASLTDLLDGRLARSRGRTTDLGAKLDVEVDSLGILIAFILGVKFGQLPAGFAAVGGLFYAYRLLLWLWRRRGGTVHALPYSAWRATIGGFEVGFLCVMLWPVFGPPYTTAVGAAITLPVLASFLWDGLIALGVLDPDTAAHQRATRRLRRLLLGVLPRGLRVGAGVAAALLLVDVVGQGASVGTTAGAVGVAAAAAATALGWGRWRAPLALLVTSALFSLVVPVTASGVTLVVASFLLLLIAAGPAASGSVRA